MTSGIPLYLSHTASTCQKDGKHTVMMPRQGLVSGQTAANCKADGLMYPLPSWMSLAGISRRASWIRLLEMARSEAERPGSSSSAQGRTRSGVVIRRLKVQSFSLDTDHATVNGYESWSAIQSVSNEHMYRLFIAVSQWGLSAWLHRV